MTQTPKSWISATLGDRYKIESLLGRGGMSSVYRATDDNLKRAVAVKIIHPQLTKQSEFVQQFEQEATAVAQLRHQNIVRVYDFKRDDGIYYIVLEYIPGETLAEKLAALNEANMRLPLTEGVRIAINLCDAVDYAHQRRMIHRDIKPQNVMINLLNEPILMDFGIAKLVGRDINNLGEEEALGSALYMSPEQAKGESIDFRTDIYSLGVVLYELISGYPPFQGKTTQEIIQQQINNNPPDLHLLDPSLPQTLITVVEKAMEKNPELRYQKAADMTTALRSVVLTLQNPLEAIGSRQLEHLSRLWLQATEAFDEENYFGCIEKIDELTRTGADYQQEQAKQLRQESIKRLYDQGLAFFQAGKFDEALVVVTTLRELAPTYPNLEHLESQVRQSVQSDTIQSDLDTLYDEAVALLEASQYQEALTKWEEIDVKRGLLPYRDSMQVEERAKAGICTVLYNDAFLAVSDRKPYEALDYWKEIKAIDPDFEDEDGVLELAQRMFKTDKEIRRRDKRMIFVAVVLSGLILISQIILAVFNREDDTAAELSATESSSTVVAIAEIEETPTATKTIAASATAVSIQTAPANTVIIEATATTLPSATPLPTKTALPSPTFTSTPTETPSPTETPTPEAIESPTPTNVGLILENSSLFSTPNLGGEELAIVETGDSVTILGRSEDRKWLFVGNGDLAGFVFNERLQWDGDINRLPIFNRSDNDEEIIAEATPVASDEITPLTFDLWPLPETAVCTDTGWEQDLFFQGHGGNGIYAYYWDGTLLEGPTNNLYIYRLKSPGGSVTGYGRVESGGGLWQQSTIFVEAPNCP